MQRQQHSTVFSIQKGKLQSLKQAEVFVLLLSEEDTKKGSWVQPEIDREILRLMEKGLFKGSVGDVEIFSSMGHLPAAYLAVVGVGSDKRVQQYRDAGVYLARKLRERQLDHVVVQLSQGESALSLEDKVYSLTEGMALGQYRIRTYAKNGAAAYFQNVTFLVEELQEERITSAEKSMLQGQIYAEAINYARDLTNLPGNELVPDQLAQEAVEIGKKYSMECNILDENTIQELGMGGLYHVGKGSIHPPRMIVLKYQGLEEWKDVWGIVGKGITFDTGGISMKDPAGMEEMISDMGGAATILGFMEIVGRLKPKANVLVVIPAAENMPSGGALKPGDVITSLSGRTIEVLNTDAEGRIVLGDGVTYAKQLGATRIIDVATLTGAVLTILGDVATAALTNDDAFMKEFLAAADQAGEKVWQLPNYPEYREMLRSNVADMKNATANKWAGVITAGLFIGEFAEDTPWIHLDTGGSAWLWSDRGTDPRGGTGVLVRTLAELICK